VDERQFGGKPLVGQVGEEGLELTGRQHALVDDGPRRQRREVDIQLPLRALAQGEGHSVEFESGQVPVGSGHEELGEEGHRFAGGLPDDALGDGHLTPTKGDQPLFAGNSFHPLQGSEACGAVLWQIGHARGIPAGRRQRERHGGTEELIGDLGEDAGAVTDQRIRARRTTVVQIAERVEGVDDDVVSGRAAHGRDHGHTTRVVLVGTAVEALVRGLC